MTFPFFKMHGAGNDFVVVRDDARAFPLGDAELVRRINAPHSGLQSEGMLVLRPAPAGSGADVRMHFFNPDGLPAAMCGNGSRCAAFAARRWGLAGRSARILSDAGLLEAEIAEGESPFRAEVRVRTTAPQGRRPAVRPPESAREFFFVDTGVPHAVAFVEGLAAVDVASEGAAVRRSAAFAPAGTNVDFAEKTGPRSLSIRTFERGVEAETAACGTGAIAAAVAAVETGRCEPPVAVRVAFGDTLLVEPERDAAGLCRGIRFTGPARVVCEGLLDTAAFAD